MNMSTWHQERKGHPLPRLSHPTQWRSHNPQGHLSVITFSTKGECTQYCGKTGDIPVPPHSEIKQALPDTATKVETVRSTNCCAAAKDGI